MSELEKCLRGELYDSHDLIFKNHKKIANNFLRLYNQMPYSKENKRKQLLKQNLGYIGKYSTVGTPFLCDLACNIYLGDKVSVNMNCSFMDSNKIFIDNETMIGPNVQIYTASHPVNVKQRLNRNWDKDKSKHFVMTYAKPVHIKKGCWLGGGAIVLPGITIGENTVIGAGSVVTKNIPNNVVVVGNPGHIINKIKH